MLFHVHLYLQHFLWPQYVFHCLNSLHRYNIIIRSILNFQKNNEVFAASGVILDSTAKNEYRENYLKAKSLLDLLK